MILWCAYCQRYQGERPPFEDYWISHGLCASCASSGAAFDDGQVAKTAPVRALYDRLRAFARTAGAADASAELAEAMRLGIRPRDLALGMLAPVLHEIGDLWARGELDVAREHAATQRVRDLLDLTYTQFPECAQYRNAKEPTVLLCTPTSNRHTLGLKFVELALAVRGVPTQRMASPASVADIVAKVAVVRPRWVGVSMALPSQRADAEDIAAGIAASGLRDPPRVVVGGGPLRHGTAPGAPSGMEEIASADDFAAMVVG